MTSTFASPSSFRGHVASNELDVLLEDLSKARYNGGAPSYEKTEESTEMYSTSIVQQLNGYHPENSSAPANKLVPRNKATDGVIRELESLTTEEETIIEESQHYKINFGNNWGNKSPRGNKKNLTSTTTVYAEVNSPTAYVESTRQEINELSHTLFWSKMREEPVDMPVKMEVPNVAQKLHETFDKPGIKEGQNDPNYRVRFGMNEEGQVEEETEWVMPELPEEPPRKFYNCAACTKAIQGRCITAMMRKFHPEHFVCSYCLKQLNKGTFKEREDKPYCQECYYRLFG